MIFPTTNSIAQTQTFQPFFDTEEKVILKTAIDVLDQHFSGLLIIKQLEPNVYRAIFTTELGMKVYDYEIRTGVSKQMHLIPILQRKILDKRIKRDLALLVASFPNIKVRSNHIDKKERRYRSAYGRTIYRLNQFDRAEKMIHRGKLGKKKVAMNAVYNDTGLLQMIAFKHPGIISFSGQYFRLTP